VLDVQAGMLLPKVLQRFSLMGGRMIQQHDHRAAQMPQQLAEKDANFLLPDVIEVKLIVQAQALSLRTYRNPGNDGDLVPPLWLPKTPSDLKTQGFQPFVRLWWLPRGALFSSPFSLW